MNTKKYYWTTKNGTKIDVDEMTDEHLRNTLKMIIRNNSKSSSNGIVPFSKSEIDAITGGDNVSDLEPYCDDYMWKQHCG